MSPQQLIAITASPLSWAIAGKELFYVAPNRKMMSVANRPGATFRAGAPLIIRGRSAPVRISWLLSTAGKRSAEDC
jgi:hypothetical protein